MCYQKNYLILTKHRGIDRQRTMVWGFIYSLDLTLKPQMNNTVSKLDNSTVTKVKVKQRNNIVWPKESKTIENIAILSPGKQLTQVEWLNADSVTNIKKACNSPSKEISSLKRSPAKKDNITTKRTNFTKLGKRFDLLEKNIEKCASAKQILNSSKNPNERSLNKSKNSSQFGVNLK